MSVVKSHRLSKFFPLIVISLVVAGCSGSQSTVVEPKSEIAGRQVAIDSRSANTSSGVTVADIMVGDLSVQQNAPSTGATAEPPGSAQSPVSSPTLDVLPTGVTVGPTGTPQSQSISFATVVPAVNEVQPKAPATVEPPALLEPPLPARKLLVDRKVTVDLGRTSGKVVLQ